MKKIIIGVLYASLLLSAKPVFSIGFTITEIGDYRIAGINNSGQVAVQYTSTQGPQRAGIWQNGNLQELGLTGSIAPSFEQHEIKGINNSGQVILREITTLQSYIWDNGTFTNVGNLPNTGGVSSGTEAFGINDLGQVVGGSWTGSQYGYQPFISNNGSITSICNVGGIARSINNNGQIVGYGCGAGTFLYENGVFTTLTDFGVSDINNNGIMAGQATGFDSGGRAAIWTNSGLNVLSDTWGESNSINDSGLVVGTFNNGLLGNNAFLWGDVFGLLNLNDYVDPTSSINLVNAIDINDSGEIIATGILTIGESTFQRSFLLTPTAVPVPAAAWLFGSGFLVFIGFMRRKI